MQLQEIESRSDDLSGHHWREMHVYKVNLLVNERVCLCVASIEQLLTFCSARIKSALLAL